MESPRNNTTSLAPASSSPSTPDSGASLSFGTRTPTLTLRDYQHDALAAIENAYARGVNRQAIAMATGSGKTVVFAELMRRLPDMEYAADGPVFRNSALVRTCDHMLVRYTPEQDVADVA